MWVSRAREKHWVEKNWPPRSDLKPGDPNIVHEPLVDRKKIIFPPLHIKLGLMKQFVKALSTDGDCLKYIILTVPGLSIKKSSPVCLIVHKFDSSSRMNSSPVLSDLEKNAWLSFKDVVKNLLRNTRASNYTEIVQKLLESYKALDCNMSIKLHFLHCHLATFRKILVLLATSKVSDFTKI